MLGRGSVGVRRGFWAAATASVGLALFGAGANALCNAIPGAATFHRGAIGGANRPFASPGDFVGVEVNTGICEFGRTGLAPTGAGHVVTVLYDPPNGAQNAVVLAPDCTILGAEVSACGSALSGTAACVQVTPAELFVRDSQSQAGTPRRQLFFSMPSTAGSAAFGTVAGHDLSGPAKIVVTAAGQPLQCAPVASQSCAAAEGGATPIAALACIDQLFELDGTCNQRDGAGGGADDRDDLFAHFTALPAPNEFAALCAPGSDPGCTGTASEIRFTTDDAGNLLFPVDYTGVLTRVGAGNIPVARLAEGFVGIGRSSADPTPPFIPTVGFLDSYAPNGAPLAPFFTPLSDPSTVARVFGSIDAERGVVRVARTSPDGLECDSGVRAGVPCTDAVDCNTSSSGTAQCVASAGSLPELFEFRDRFDDGGVGPVTTGAFNFAVSTTVQLSGLVETNQSLGFVVDEALDGIDLNGDGDTTDFVLRVASKADGSSVDMGFAGSEGLGISRQVRDTGLLPILVAEGDVLACMASEAREQLPLSGLNAAGGDPDQVDAVAMAFDPGTSGSLELLTNQSLTQGPQNLGPFPFPGIPFGVIDGRAMRLSNGLLAWADSEALNTSGSLLLASSSATGGAANGASRHGAGSDFAQWVAFESLATNVVNPPRANAFSEIFVTDPFGNGTKRLMSGAQPDGGSFAPYVSRTGRFVAFESDSSTSQSTGNLPSGLPPLPDVNVSRDILVADRDPDQNGTLDDTAPNITRVNLTAGGLAQAPASIPYLDPVQCAGFPLWGSREPQVSPDGRHIVFSSDAQLDLVNDGVPGVCAAFPAPLPLYLGLSVYAVDRDPDGNGVLDEGNQTTTLIGGPFIGGNLSILRSPTALGAVPATSILPITRQMTDDGRFVAYDSFDNEDALLDLDLCPDVYLLDRDSDGNGTLDEAGGTRRHLVSRDNATPAFADCGTVPNYTVQSLSEDGERVVYLEIDTSVVPPRIQVFQFDLSAEDPVLGPTVPGAITLVSENVFGGPADAQAGLAQLSQNGAADFVAFSTVADFMLEDDVDGLVGGFFRDPETGLTVGAQGGAPGSGFAVSTVQSTFQGAAVNSALLDTVAPGDTNGLPDVVLGYVDFTLPWNAAQDVNADGDINDGYFRIADVGAGGQPIALEADTYGAMAPDGSLAYTRNEGDLAQPAGVDWNGDGDFDDLVIQLHPGRAGGANLLPAGAAQNLGLAIFEDAAPDQTLAASDTRVAALISEAGEGVDFTQDGDLDDGVLAVWDRVGGGWTFVPSGGPEPVSALILQDDFVGVSVSEEEAGADLNGDFDLLDEVGFVYDAATDTVFPTDQAVSDALFGENIIAFRTPEADQGQDLNNDGDMDDFVLQVWDLVNQKVISSGSSAVLCTFEICDPTRPFRIEDDVVRFLTREQDEGRDLNDDFDTDDLIVQLFNPFAAQGAAPVRVVTTVTEPPPPVPGQPPAPSVGFDPLAPAPLDQDGSSVVQLGQGICRDGAGAPGTTCNTDADCLQAAGETCQPEATAVAAQNSDGDPLPDPLDNCPTTDNPDQLDRDFDGVGDLCDAETCGDGFITGSETCDDSQLPPLNGDGCSQFCRVAGCGGDVNLDGFVNQTDVDQFANSAGCYPCQGPGCNEALCDLNADTHVNNADVLLLQGIIPAQCAPGGGILGGPPPPPSCGLGPELVLLLPGLLALRRRRRS